MKILTLLLISVITIFAIVSCSTENKNREEEHKFFEKSTKLKILSTTAMINDLVKEVGGEYVDSISLIRGELDPHSYELVKGDDEKFALADLIFSNGLGLEHGLSLKQNLDKNSKVYPLGDTLLKESPSPIIIVDGQYDPHIWMDIALWMKTVPTIANAMSAKDPSHSLIYQQNAEALLKKMAKVDESVYKTLQDVPSCKRYLVTSHDAFNYFTRHYLATPEERSDNSWYIRFAAPEGLSPDAQLSVSDIQEIIDYIVEYKVSVVFPESNVSKDSLRKILDASRKKGIPLRISSQTLYGDAMGPEGSEGDTYLKMINHNAQVISDEFLKSDKDCS